MKQRLIRVSVAYPILALCMSACTLTPELPSGGRVAASDPADLAWPELLPSGQLTPVPTVQDPRVAELDEETQAILKRAEALRRKAAALNTPILTQNEADRLTNARN